jgi:hypothetical protein
VIVATAGPVDEMVALADSFHRDHAASTNAYVQLHLAHGSLLAADVSGNTEAVLHLQPQVKALADALENRLEVALAELLLARHIAGLNGPAALPLLRDTLVDLTQIPDSSRLINALPLAAALLAQAGRHEAAAILCGTLDEGWNTNPMAARDIERARAIVQNHFGEQQAARYLADGSRLTRVAAVQLALDEIDLVLADTNDA